MTIGAAFINCFNIFLILELNGVRALNLSFSSIAAAFAALCLLSQSAQAVTFSYTEDLVTVPTSVSNVMPTSSTGTVVLETLSIPGITRSPFENFNATPGPGYGSAYISINIGSALYSFSTPKNELSVFWGSPDSYNTLSFYASKDGTGTPLFSLTGSSLLIQTYGHDLVNFQTLDGFFNSVVLSSTDYAFEFTNLSTSDPVVPLPAALPLFATGLGALGLLGWRRKKKAKALSA